MRILLRTYAKYIVGDARDKIARGFREFIDERRVALPEFFLNALRP